MKISYPLGVGSWPHNYCFMIPFNADTIGEIQDTVYNSINMQDNS